MTKKTGVSGIHAKLKAKGIDKAHKAVRSNPVETPSGGRLPAGIEGGIAKLRSVTLGEYKNGAMKGEPYLMAAAIVIAPAEHNGIPVKGLQTRIGPEPLCDTPDKQGENARKTLKDHVNWCENQIKLLGIDAEEYDSFVDMVEAVNELANPTKQYPNPRINETWMGVKGMEDYVPDEEDGIETDEEEEEDETAESEEEETEESEEAEDETEGADEEESSEEAEEEEDWLAVGKVADGKLKAKAEAAQQKLNDKAKELGIDPEEYETWTALAEALTEAGSEESEEDESEEAEEEEEEAEEIEPSKGDTFGYKPPKSKRTVECEVVAVLKKAKTVKLKDMDSGKLYDKVPFDQLVAL